jgi:3-hydroxy-5-methyl-1-naphthoate 3-O-methyltransferase
VKPEFRRIRERVRLTRLALGGLAANVLYVANDVGLFDVLHRMGPATAEDVARELNADADATRRVLGALTALELVEHDDQDRFTNGFAAREFLLAGAPESMNAWASLVGIWNQRFGDLATVLRTGEPVQDPEEHLGASPAYTRTFILGMHDYAIGPGRELARYLDLGGRTRLLDVGGGPGTYSILLAEANPDLRCTVFDLPPVVAIADEVIAKHDLVDRVTTAGGDYHSDDFPRGFDAVLVSNTLHQEDWDTCIQILRQAFDSVEPGGLGVIHAMFLNETGDGPLWPTLHSLVLQSVYRGGRAYTAGQTFEMLEAAGFRDPELHTMSPFNAGAFVTATRP